ncbi:uncharacterized protein LOC62_01G001017 [Vanrija pseudolonga]|uniref:Galactose oxidase n=1 Tax=Vanrija pseudolonga TaxID=143232 RepID=A0AAF0Y3N7_9TREE|nr:hypothetical protein LOC62_01G001017 [Vanrija pseudolonga]
MRLLAALVAGAQLATAATTAAAAGYVQPPAAAPLTSLSWGQSGVLLGHTSTLFIQGGKVDTPGYTYTSAPNTAAALVLPLNTSFSASSPPLASLSTPTPPNAPDYAWGCIAPTSFDPTTSTWTLLAFGGAGPFNSAAPTGADDSAWTVTLNTHTSSVSLTHQPSGWGSQPSRRQHLACVAYNTGGMVYITGGQSTNDVGAPFATAFVFDPATSTFRPLPDLPVALFHHMSVLLPSGILVVLGGVYINQQTGMPAIQPLSVVFTLDTTNPNAGWVTVALSGPVPPGRRGASATVITSSEVFVFGGADVTAQTAYGDAWVLNLSGGGNWTQVITQGPSPRFDHTAADGGNGQVIIYGGYPATSSNPGVDIIQVTPASSGSGSGTTSAPPSATPVTSYTPPSSSDSSSNGQGTTNGGSSPGASAGLPTGVAPAVGGGGQASLTSMWLTTTGGGATAAVTGETESAPSPTGTSAIPPAAKRNGLTSMQVAALATSVSIIGAALLGIFIWLCCFRRRHRYSHTDRVEEKDLPVLPTSRGLLASDPTADDDPWVIPKRNAMAAALGVGISRVATTIRKVSGGPEADAYTRLPTGRPSRGLSRHSTRRVGTGIMLVGATPNVMEAEEFEDLPQLTPMVATDSARSRRFSMLRNEDVAVQRDPWAGISDRAINRGSIDEWHPAHSLLSRNGSRLTSPPGSPMTHGPVPTPVDSLRGGPPPTPVPVHVLLNDTDPFADEAEAQSALENLLASRTSTSKYRLPDFAPGTGAPLAGGMGSLVSKSYRRSLDLSVTPPGSYLRAGPSSPPSRQNLETSSLLTSRGRASLDAGSYLAPSDRRTSDNSYSSYMTPKSMTSSMELTEEAVISHARLVSKSSASIVTPSVGSPPTTAASRSFQAIPVLTPPSGSSRSSDILRRVSGGIKDATRRLSGMTPPAPVREEDIRDPAPQPSLWPLQLTGDSSERSHVDDDSPTTDFTPLDLFAPLRSIRLDSYASMNTLGTARSMTDMMVVQRDHADDVSAEVILDETGTPQSSVNSRTTFVTAHQSIASRNSRASRSSIPHTPPRQVREADEWEEEVDELLHPEGEHHTPKSGRSGLSGHTFGSVYTSASSTEVLPATSPPSSPARQAPASESATPRPLTPIPSTPPPRVSPGLVFATPPRVTSAGSVFGSPPRAISASSTPGRTVVSPTPRPFAPSAPTTPSRLIPQVVTTPPPSTPTRRPLPVTPSSSTLSHAAPPLLGSPISSSSPTKPLTLKRTAVTPVTAPAGATPPTVSSPASGRNPRRPVKDVVASINRRGGGVPSLFDSPTGTSSQSPTTSASRSSSTRFETVHKAPLKIANPDAQQRKDSGGS